MCAVVQRMTVATGQDGASPSESATASSYRIKGFDGLRAIAVLLVFLHHNTGLWPLDLGGYGVHLFFVLSGFLIIGILHASRRRIEAGGAKVTPEWLGFVKRRSLRIFPAYYLVLLIAIPVALEARKIDGVGALMLSTYTANIWIGEVAGTWVRGFSHLWSLSIEEQFYLVAPAIFLCVEARHHLRFCFALIVGALIAQLILVARHATGLEIYTNSMIGFGMIAFGGAMFLLILDQKPVDGRSSVLSTMLLAVFLASPFLATLTIPIWSSVAIVSVGALLVRLFLNQASTIVAVLEFTPLRWFGRVSYGFYLYHNFLTVFQMVTVCHWLGLRVDVSTPWLVPMSFAVSLAVATASWALLERPIQRLGQRRRELPRGETITA